MEQYKKYFSSFENFKSKKNIVDDLSALFPDLKVTDTFYKKIVDNFILDGTLKEISEKKKRFFISSEYLLANNISIEDLYSKNKLGILTGNALKERKVINLDDYLKEDAINEFSLSEMFK
jgi:hypothetical protein